MASEDPIHLAIIPDGNRRWAKSHTLLPWKGHERAMENFRTLIEWCRKDPRVGVLTVWGFSTENWKRSEEEIGHLMRLFEEFLTRERETLLKEKTRFAHSGRKDRIPPSLAALIAETERETAAFTGFTFHLALDYGGRDEVTRAVRKLEDPASAGEDGIRALLDHPEIPDIDLILRTSGEQRTSNFFLWQSGYAEWIFVQKHFPELTPEDLEAAVGEFARRTRRFGGG